MQLVTGHHDWLRAIALSSDGATALVGGYDATLAIYDLLNGQVGEERRRGSEPQNAISPLVFPCIPPQCKQTLTGHFSYVNAVAMGLDNKLAISASEDGQAIVWNLKTAQVHINLQGHEAAINDVDFIDDRRAVTASSDGEGGGG